MYVYAIYERAWGDHETVISVWLSEDDARREFDRLEAEGPPAGCDSRDVVRLKVDSQDCDAEAVVSGKLWPAYWSIDREVQNIETRITTLRPEETELAARLQDDLRRARIVQERERAREASSREIYGKTT